MGVVLLVAQQHNLYSTRLGFPFFKALNPDLGWWYVPFTMFVLAAWSNAVNLTDGLDGLAISTFTIAAAAFTALTYIVGHKEFASICCSSTSRRVGADDLLRRAGRRVARLPLVTRTRPKSSWAMSDPLALGAALGTVAILIKQELLLRDRRRRVRARGALRRSFRSASFKMTGQRVFRMAPHSSSLRADRVERAEGHHAVRDRRDHLRAVQS